VTQLSFGLPSGGEALEGFLSARRSASRSTRRHCSGALMSRHRAISSPVRQHPTQ
jgi:hypothetical protein